MEIDLIPIDKLIAVNNLKEVSDPVLFDAGFIPTEKGLLSKTIFGNNVKDRRETFAYVNLHSYYFAPYVFKLVRKLDKNIEHILFGRKYFKVDEKGKLVVSDEEQKGYETGLTALYKHWDKIKFERNKSTIRNDRIDLIESIGKNTIFTKYWIVIPAFYRDANISATDGKPSHNEINVMYSRLIRLSSTAQDANQFDFTMTSTQARVQDTLVEIYDFLKGQLEKKNGLIRKSLLGKSIDYGARAVISAPSFDTDRKEDLEVNFYTAGVPLSMCCSLCTPFIMEWVKNFFISELQHQANRYPIVDKSGKVTKYVKLEDPASYYNEEYLKKKIDRFVHSPANRFDLIEIPIAKSEGIKEPIYMKIAGRFSDKDREDPTTTSPLIDRPATWTDILYMAAVDVTSDKHVWVTRYPLLDYFGIFPNRITVMSTVKTQPMYIGDKVYPRYPVIDLDISPEKLLVNFVDTARISNLYLQGLGGDYDGDQVTLKVVFSQEANLEAERILTSKTHIINIYGKNMRTTTNEAVLTLYMMTKRQPK